MKLLKPIDIIHHACLYELRLGRVYKVVDKYDKDSVCLFINTTRKGFNFLNLKNARCRFQKTLYQKNSGSKTVGRKKTVFEIVIPDHISKIYLLNQKETKSLKCFGGLCWYSPKQTKEYEPRESTVETFENAIDGLELD